MNDIIDEAENAYILPLIGDNAPEFVAQTTNGEINFPGDYAGKWVVLFSHPSDFTPVCTSEFMTLQYILPQLQEINTEIIGLSVGSITSHLGWINDISNVEFRGWKNIDITFPVIDDATTEIARRYGMIHPGTSSTHTVRAVFIIDPKGIIRTILYYPAILGRNFEEIKRILVGLQTADAFGVALPADWMPGEAILDTNPKTTTEMRKSGIKSWFFIQRDLPKETIFGKILKPKKK